MKDKLKYKRIVSLCAGVILNLLGGISYAWSVLIIPLNQKYSWSVTELSLGYTLLSMTTLIANLLLVPVIRERLNVKQTILLGGVLYGLGIAFSGFTSNVMLFYLSFPIIAGIGCACIYPVLIAYSQKLFPKQAGFASGMMTLGMGLGAAVWAPCADFLLTVTGDVSKVLFIMGVFFLIAIFLVSRFIESENSFSVSNLDIKNTTLGIRGECRRKEMLRDPVFYLTYGCLLSCAICGSMVISHGSPILQELFLFDRSKAAVFVSIFSLANTVGRPIGGYLSDRIGRMSLLGILPAICCASMLCILLHGSQLPPIIAFILIMLSFGGMASLVAPITKDFWGERYLVENYGITFSVFGISSLIGPSLAAKLYIRSGNYMPSFVAGSLFALLGFFLFVMIKFAIRETTQRGNEI